MAEFITTAEEMRQRGLLHDWKPKELMKASRLKANEDALVGNMKALQDYIFDLEKKTFISPVAPDNPKEFDLWRKGDELFQYLNGGWKKIALADDIHVPVKLSELANDVGFVKADGRIAEAENALKLDGKSLDEILKDLTSDITINDVQISNSAKGLAIAKNNLQLYIRGNTWGKYQNLPEYLVGGITTLNINDSNNITINLLKGCEGYLIRKTDWAVVPLEGWEEVYSGDSLITSYNTAFKVYKKVFVAGEYSLDNYSAIYIFK